MSEGSASLEDLLRPKNPGWSVVLDFVREATNPVVVQARDAARSEATLLALGVPTSTAIGGVAYACAGITVDDGWLRILGGGSAAMPRDLAAWNRLPGGRLPGAWLVADDAIGGFFALDAGLFSGAGSARANVFYLEPDAPGAAPGEWDALDLSYTDFLEWAFSGDVREFYGEARFRGYRELMGPLGFDRVLVQGGENVSDIRFSALSGSGRGPLAIEAWSARRFG